MAHRSDWNNITDYLDMGYVLRIVLDSRSVVLPPARSDLHLLLGRISSKWRHALISDPSSWDTYTFLNRKIRDPRKLLDAFHAFVARSGSLPLSFVVTTDPRQYETQGFNNIPTNDLVYASGRIGVVAQIIFPYLERIQHFHCLVSCAKNSSFLLNLPQGIFQTLEAIDWGPINNANCTYPSFSAQERFSSPPSDSLPLVNEPVCRAIFMGGLKPSYTEFQWWNATRLDFSNTPMDPDEVTRIMEHSCRSLVEASFQVEFDIESIRSELRHRFSMRQIDMCSLRKLHFRLINAHYYPRFIHLLFLPVLRELWVEQSDENGTSSWNIPLYTSWLCSATNSLELLILTHDSVNGQSYSHNRTPSSDQLEALFQTIPRLQSLCFPVNIPFPSSILARISQGVLLPSIKTLEFAMNGDPRIIFDMVSDRNVVADPSSSNWWHILALNLTISTTYLPRKAELTGKGESFNLPGGCRLQFVEL